MAPRTASHNGKIAAALRERGLGKSPTKVCPGCLVELPRASFHLRTNGHSEAYCRPCQNAKQKVRNVQLRTNPAWRQYMADANRRTVLRIKYGITVEEFDRLFALQGGVCAICKGPPNRGRKHFDVDHCHDSDRIRGLLCSNCNRALGLFQDDSARLSSAIEYLSVTKLKHGEDHNRSAL